MGPHEDCFTFGIMVLCWENWVVSLSLHVSGITKFLDPRAHAWDGLAETTCLELGSQLQSWPTIETGGMRARSSNTVVIAWLRTDAGHGSGKFREWSVMFLLRFCSGFQKRNFPCLELCLQFEVSGAVVWVFVRACSFLWLLLCLFVCLFGCLFICVSICSFRCRLFVFWYLGQAFGVFLALRVTN